MQTALLLQNLERSLDNCMLADRWKLRSDLRQLQRLLQGKEADEPNQQRLAALAERVDRRDPDASDPRGFFDRLLTFFN